MAGFYSYPINYQIPQTDKKAKIVSNRSTRDLEDNFVEIGSSDTITFDLSGSDLDTIDAIQVVCENIKKVSVGSETLGFLSNPKYLAERGGMLYTIDDSTTLCAMDLTGRCLTRITRLNENLVGLSANAGGVWGTTANNLGRLEVMTGNLKNPIIPTDADGDVSIGPIGAHQGEIYMVNSDGVHTINLANGDTIKKSDSSDAASKNLTSFGGRLYSLSGNQIKVADAPNFNWSNFSVSNLGTAEGLTSVGKNLYALNSDSSGYDIKKISVDSDGGSAEDQSKGKQYLFNQMMAPLGLSDATLTFQSNGGGKIYQVLLLKKKIDIRFSSPTPGVSDPRIDPIEGTVFPSDFSEIEHVQSEHGVSSGPNVYGEDMKTRPYCFEPKYRASYTTPLRSLDQVRRLQKFREENLNFTFAPNPIVYPDRVFPAHFSSFELPIGHQSQIVRGGSESENIPQYTFNFTIMEN